MKRLLLLSFAVGFGLSVVAQQTHNFKTQVPQHKAVQKIMAGIEPIKSGVLPQGGIIEQSTNGERDANLVTIINLGSSANAYTYGYNGGQKSIVSAIPELNMVTNFHRMGGVQDPGGYSGDLGFDVSVDGGLNWTNMNEMYIATNNAGGTYYTDAGRYPNHGLWNPAGNTDLNNARLVYFAPTLDGSNSSDNSWGGYAYGRVNLGDYTDTTKNLSTSHDDIYQYTPDAFDIKSDGNAFIVDINQDWTSGTVAYMGNLLINRLIWNESDGDYELEQVLLDAPVDEATTRPSHTSVAFGADGQTGYIAMIADNGSTEVIGGGLGMYPVFFKTTDGGQSWSNPIGIQLAGPDGMSGIINDLLTDEQIAQLYEAPVPARDEIPYTTAFDCDIAVDANGNLHIGVVIGVVGTDAYSIVTSPYMFAAYDIYTTDGGTNWYAVKLGYLNLLRGYYPDDAYPEDNRIQITTSPDRETIFVSWIDTDMEEVDNNSRPNIFSRGMRPNAWGTADLTCSGGLPVASNVTMLTEGMWNASFAAVSNVSLYADGKYTIPMTYLPMTGEIDPTLPVVFKYITNFFFTDADFCVVGTDEIAMESQPQVSQNFPNPFSDETNINVTLGKGSNVSIEIYNLTGQKVYTNNYGYKPAGSFTMSIQSDNMPTGVYFYTVDAGATKATLKMIVK
ncbi:MAG: T9SS type A sorting domain-containing protein [Bacteroidales bacterium]|nr:T9SS type A sorting domain-containing protein [Bacteroidales bacterium]